MCEIDFALVSEVVALTYIQYCGLVVSLRGHLNGDRSVSSSAERHSSLLA